MHEIRIPINFPIDYFIEKWSGFKKDNQINRLDTLFIILNEFTRTNLKNGWIKGVPLNNEAFRAVCSKNFDNVKNELLAFKKGTVFFTDGKYDPGFQSKWYKLGKQYCYSSTIEVELVSQKRHQKYLDYLSGDRVYKKEIEKIEPKFHLERQFKDLKINLDEKVFDYKRIYIYRYIKLISNEKNQKIKFLYYGKIGKIIDDINRLKNPEKYTYKLSDKNLRFNSIFTNINKGLRYFIRHNGNSFIELDLVASHSYVLATILNKDFFFDGNKEYSIHRVFPDLLLRINSFIDASNNYYNNINYTEAQEAASRRFYHHMSDRFFDNDDITLYRSTDFETDFYGFINDIYQNINPNSPLLSREKIKSIVRLWMNHTDPHERKRVKSIDLLKQLFPSIELLIREIGFFKSIKSAFSLLLQRAESHLVLDVVGKKIIEEYPSARIFTIHDSYFVEDSNIDINELIGKIKGILKDYVDITPGIKVKESNPFDSVDQIIEEDIVEIKKKASKKETILTEINERLFNPVTIRHVEIGINELFINHDGENIQNEFNNFICDLYPD